MEGSQSSIRNDQAQGGPLLSASERERIRKARESKFEATSEFSKARHFVDLNISCFLAKFLCKSRNRGINLLWITRNPYVTPPTYSETTRFRVLPMDSW